jgi:hypothetical protein
VYALLDDPKYVEPTVGAAENAAGELAAAVPAWVDMSD